MLHLHPSSPSPILRLTEEKEHASLHQQSMKPRSGCAAGQPPRVELGRAKMAKRTGWSPPFSAHCRFLLFLLLCCSFPSPIASQGAPAAADAGEERRVLLQMKAEWGNPPSLSSWNPSSSPCSGPWNGVTCGGDGSVTVISLVEQGIEGSVPNTTCRLGNLSALNLFNNSVGGTFPTVLYDCTNLRSLNLSQNLFVGRIPADIDRLSNLTALDLSYNNFSGDVPAALARVAGLRQLRLDNNLFDGAFPKELGSLAALENLTLANNPFVPLRLPTQFGNLTRLRYLFLAEANLVGDIPESFGNLTDLEHLDLSKNNLNGTIPSRIWQLENLQFVYLYHNKLSGTIAGGPVAASGLTEIDLSMNELSGTIPEDFGRQLKLRLLFLYNNWLSGEIPDSIARVPTLTDIRLFTNKLTGGLPPDLGKYSQLVNLEVNNNELSGELPESLCAGRVLNSLVVFNNSFTGGVPKSLGDCPSLTTLQVQDSGLSGEVPAGIWSLPKLTMVIMNRNMLSGKLPETLPSYLSRLDIRENGFTGRVPSSSPSLQIFWASNNLFSGEIPSDLKGMPKLSELFLDRNRISGEIPAGIGSLRSLISLNLSANQLAGSIPREVASLPVLTYLDLSENRLSGEIPTALGSLRLNFLNLSSNSLTGEVPPVLQNPACDRSFLLNPGLCSSNTVLNIPGCGDKPHSSSDGLAKGLLTLFLVLGVLVLLFISLVGFYVVMELRRRKNGGDVASWKLTSFQSVDFEESNIVRGLTASNLVGSGGSGEVYRVPLGNRAAEVVAVKKIWNRRKQDAELEREFEAEVKILGSVRHANIVKLLCCISSADSELLVYEYMENGSLDQWLHGKRSGTGYLDWPARLSIAVGAARGLCYMHHDCSPPIVHRDVKSSNILLDSGLRAKVADFGLARMLERPGQPDTVSAVAGSIGYMAPECGYSRKVNEKLDVYSFGVVLLELTTGREAKEGDGRGGLAEWARRHLQEGNSVEEALDGRIRDPLHVEEMSVVLRLGLFCTGVSPPTRPSMKEVLQVLLRCAQRHGDRDEPGRENDGAPLLQDKPPSDSDDGEDVESSLACSV